MSEPLDDVLPGIGSALQLQTAPEQIADRLLAAIAVGVLYPGERLPSERELAAQLNVSRPTLRFALQRLVALGVLEARRGRSGGTFVREVPPNTDDARAIVNVLEPLWAQFEQMLDYRNLIHQIIARTAAARRTPEDIEAMRLALKDYALADSAADSRRADHALHDAVATATQNRQLLRLSRSLTSAVNLGFSADPYSDDLHQRALHQHTNLIEEIVAGDGEKALHIAAEHFHVTSTEPWHRALFRSQLRLTDEE